jgi:hypothetical protein
MQPEYEQGLKGAGAVKNLPIKPADVALNFQICTAEV